MSDAPRCRLAIAVAVALGAAASTGANAQPAEHSGHAQHGAPAAAPAPQHESHDAHAAHTPAASPVQPPTDADRANAFPDFGTAHMAHEMHDDPLNKAVLVDRLEAHDVANGSLASWDVDAWVGRSLTKLWIRTEGERRASATERAELELLWGKSFARWWDLVAGARRDFEPGPARDWAAVGVRGLAPYRFDIAATAYLGDGKRSALRFESTYDLLVTNKLVLQPLVELDWYGKADASRGIGAGLAAGEFGLRLRYEIRREVAPYVGLVRERKFGSTADLARANGADADDTRWVAGIRLSF